MAPQTQAPTLSVVADDDANPVERGRAIQRKREGLGMGVSELARKAGVDRATVDRVEAGTARGTSISVVERALDDVDEEMSGPREGNAEERVVRFVVRGVYGADALIVEGPVESIAELEASVDRIMRGNRKGEDRET